MQLNTVVLPAPFGPINPTTLFFGTVSETSVSALIPPKETERFDRDSWVELTRRF